MNGISYHEACAYAQWLSEKTGRIYELPSELQWEKAAAWNNDERAKYAYPWGDTWDPDKGGFSEAIHLIGAVKDDVSPYGCYDMGGNVHEWVSGSYGRSEVRAGVLKGGAAQLPPGINQLMAKGSYRAVPPDSFRGKKVGFRIVAYPLVTEQREDLSDADAAQEIQQ